MGVPTPGEEASLFQRACGEADLVLITAELAERLPVGLLAQALVSPEPLLLVVPDVRGRSMPLELGSGLRRQLGLGE